MPGFVDFTLFTDAARHGLNGSEFMDFLWGDVQALNYATYPHRPKNESKVVHLQRTIELERSSTLTYPDVDYWLDSNYFDMGAIAMSSTIGRYFNDEFLGRIRQAASCGVAASLQRLNVFTNTRRRLTVAAHIRRGDVDVENHANRFVHDSVYIALFSAIRGLYPDADLHAFTSFDTYNGTLWNIMTKHYRTFNVALHITDESAGSCTRDSLNAMAHFMTADVLIMSKSSFSAVAAYYNPNCVIYIPFWAHGLPHYIKLPPDLDDYYRMIKTVELRLPRCVNRLAKMQQLASSVKGAAVVEEPS
jgi:hypothetical protein